MGKIIALFNQKGGVGKTTTGVNLCASLVRMGRRVLLVDVDPQGHSTSGMGVDKNAASPNVYDVLIGGTDARLTVKKTRYGDVLPANKGLFGVGVRLTDMERREHRLADALEPHHDSPRWRGIRARHRGKPGISLEGAHKAPA